jgi:dipeptidyl aminopeptidase/acylaminoacyl peptidase
VPALFADELHETFGTWPIGYIPYGGADFGEVRAVATAVGDGDDDQYFDCWIAAGTRLQAEADASLQRGHVSSARELYLRASVFYGASFHLLYGAPVDLRLLAAFRRQIAAFDQGLALGTHPVQPQQISFEGRALPGYFVPAQGCETAVRPLIIFNNGYDATVTDMYFASAVAASRRGYHSLLFDGPGQGAVLYEDQVPLRPDWDKVVAAVVDFAVEQPLVDPGKIALSGWSLGGYLAPRAASGEHRIAALSPILEPGASRTACARPSSGCSG